MIAHRIRSRLMFAALVCLVLFPDVSVAVGWSDTPAPASEAVLFELRLAEKQGDWFRAADLYGQLARQNPQVTSYRVSQLAALRRGRFGKRLEDRAYRHFLGQTNLAEALSILTDVCARLQQTYVDARSVPLERLFRSGVEEIELGLSDPLFASRFLPGRSPQQISQYVSVLHERLGHPPRKPVELIAAVQELATHGARLLGMRPELVVLEMAAGVCNGLDQYTTFLIPEADAGPKSEDTSDASISEPRFLETASRIGYLRIQHFDDKTVSLLDNGMARLTNSGMRVLILDLRGNPGGLLSAAVDVADRFIARGVLVTTHGQIREYNRVYKARGQAQISVPLIVLIDGDTASSAELVAAALHDLHRGTLLGQRSFGKGTIQETVRLRGGVGITLTVARFSTPRGQAVEPSGVDPDILVIGPASEAGMAPDTQLQAALDLARTMGAMGP
ncbi:hypothetical protein BH10PLA2_BH10PLA2_31420 [soil metagenome]